MAGKKVIPVLGAASAAILALVLAACSSPPSAQQKEQSQQQADTSALDNNQPVPHYAYSQIRQTLIDAENIAANGTQTTSLFFMQGDPNPVFVCPSIGVPVANTAQLTNPTQVIGVSSNIGGGSAEVPQQDPFGIYTPASSEGTYVICVTGSGAPYLQYWEGPVMSVTAAATWDQATHSVKVTGAPTYTPKVKATP
jgi:hypothetical protein